MNLRKEVSARLIERGFRQDGRTHLLRVSGEFSLGVDTGPLGARTDIAPLAGIRHAPTESLLGKLLDLPGDEWVLTVAANVGYVLGGRYLAWQPPTPPEEVLERIDAALERLRSFLSLDRLPEAWKLQGTQDPSWKYRNVILAELRNERIEAKKLLEEICRERCQQEDPGCEEFKAFEKRFLEWIASR
jgi:hypothetical protein